MKFGFARFLDGPRRSVEIREKKEEWSMLEEIDRLVSEMLNNGFVELKSPDGKTNWRLDVPVGGGKLIAYYQSADIRVTPRGWRELNRGWGPADFARPDSQARILIGQIFIGTRASGMRLEHLKCDRVMGDGKPYGGRWL